MIADWHGKRVTVMGLGRFGGGVGVTRWLARAGARVLVTDLSPAEKLRASLDQISDLDVVVHVGGHDERDFREADVVVVNPAVREDSPFLLAARDAQTPVTTEMNLFVERCPARRCVGVTGSVGKSTVTAMIAHVLGQTVGDRRVWLGGNIGRSLLDDLDAIGADDAIVLELSSFQLQRMPAVRWSPHVAVITGITPNHIDWHGSFDAYRDAKLNIVRHQDRERDAVVIADDAELEQSVRRYGAGDAQLWRYSLDGDTPMAAGNSESRHWPDVRLGVPGRHNRLNAAAAMTAVHVLRVDPTRAAAALATFAALPDRLQRVAVRDGVTYYNDSKSTTPEAAITAMNAIETPLLIILGGYDKGSDLSGVANVAAGRTKFAACVGQTGRKLQADIMAAGGEAEFCENLATAVSACRQRVKAGDSVLLSPACASWDQFEDYRVRGAEFSRLVTAFDGGATGD